MGTDGQGGPEQQHSEESKLCFCYFISIFFFNAVTLYNNCLKDLTGHNNGLLCIIMVGSEFMNVSYRRLTDQ